MSRTKHRFISLFAPIVIVLGAVLGSVAPPALAATLLSVADGSVTRIRMILCQS
jgi:Na+/phosphate symporter